ncbi:MAG: precorrin-6y C5,15-methyltransferase (decarboxylating) subunit CbiE [Geminicoccaceae bacterium]
MSGPWLDVVGIGEDGIAGLGPAAREALGRAELVIGGRRHLAMLPEDGRPRLAWDSPLAATLERIAAEAGRPCAVLATGDPSWFGVARLLRQRFGEPAIRVHPGISAFALAAARMGWSLEGCTCTTVHGRPLDGLRRHLVPGARVLVLSEDGATPDRIAAILAGLAPEATMTVLERLGGPAERIVGAEGRPFADLNTVAIDLTGCRTAAPPTLPGLPDDAFEHDGQLTKQEARALALARLEPAAGQLLWDIGAGCGSIAIEWSRAATGARAIAVERDATRAAMLARNAARLGVPEIMVVQDSAPGCLGGFEAPDAVFVGGGGRDPVVLEKAWAALRPDGRLVAHAVTLESERTLLAFHAGHGGDLSRLAVHRAEPVGGLLGWRPLMPVTQLVARKPCAPAA